MSKDEVLKNGESDRNVFNLLSSRARPVHVAILCPPMAATTALLNLMLRHGGVFVTSQQMPMQGSNIAQANGKPNIQIWTLNIFSIGKKEFETWIGPYDEMKAYAMEEIVSGKGANP
jgi:hypothetical protein